MSGALLERIDPRRAAQRVRGRAAVDPETLAAAARIVEDVRRDGERALRAHSERLGDLRPGEALEIEPARMRRALAGLEPELRGALERSAERIRCFAEAQLGSLSEIEVAVPGGAAGHTVLPVERAGCYAPGGRFPLPSSVLMTVVPARVAGVESAWIASPRPAPVTLAAAAAAGADGLLVAGGAQAIAALAFGAGPAPACDLVVGPGNRWVTAAKQLVSGRVGIDMLAGPSELTVLADRDADPGLVAADLLAQAEHDADAVAILVTDSPALADAVERELSARLAELPTAAVARESLSRNGATVVAADVREAAEVCNLLAPEHLALHAADAGALSRRLRHCGAVFVGAGAAEVLGDYGAGPNHTLPTGGTARFGAGLSVLTFLRVRSWLRVDDSKAAEALAEDAAILARAEGLEAHARSAALRASRRIGSGR